MHKDSARTSQAAVGRKLFLEESFSMEPFLAPQFLKKPFSGEPLLAPTPRWWLEHEDGGGISGSIDGQSNRVAFEELFTGEPFLASL